MTWTCSQAVARNRSKNFATLDSTINAWDRREIAWAKRERQQQRARRQAEQSAAIDTFSADLREAMDGAREMDAALLVYRQAATKMTAAEEKSFTRLADAIHAEQFRRVHAAELPDRRTGRDPAAAAARRWCAASLFSTRVCDRQLVRRRREVCGRTSQVPANYRHR